LNYTLTTEFLDCLSSLPDPEMGLESSELKGISQGYWPGSLQTLGPTSGSGETIELAATEPRTDGLLPGVRESASISPLVKERPAQEAGDAGPSDENESGPGSEQVEDQFPHGIELFLILASMVLVQYVLMLDMSVISTVRLETHFQTEQPHTNLEYLS
jgi:hypothetical protein